MTTLELAVEIIRRNQWSHCGHECAICGGQPSYGHERWCAISKLERRLEMSLATRERPLVSESTVESMDPPPTLSSVDSALKELWKNGEYGSGENTRITQNLSPFFKKIKTTG